MHPAEIGGGAGAAGGYLPPLRLAPRPPFPPPSPLPVRLPPGCLPRRSSFVSPILSSSLPRLAPRPPPPLRRLFGSSQAGVIPNGAVGARGPLRFVVFVALQWERFSRVSRIPRLSGRDAARNSSRGRSHPPFRAAPGRRPATPPRGVDRGSWKARPRSPPAKPVGQLRGRLPWSPFASSAVRRRRFAARPKARVGD